MRRMMIAAVLIGLAAPALANRGPSQGEMSRIAASLTAAGFKSWNRVVFDGKKWKIDDARTLEGKTYDLQLSPTDYGIIKKSGD
jgi:hypothetical protein